MKKRHFINVILLGCFIFLQASLAQAEVWIKNLSLEKKGEFVTVRIYGSQPFQFTHATEEAKGGKPFRVFMDCQNSRLGLPQNNFFNLPGQTVVGLRTSQYQESPQKIVRVVLDCTRPVTYKVHSQENWAEISIASAGEPSFSRWEALKTDNKQLATISPENKTQAKPAQPAQPKAETPALTLPEVKVQSQNQNRESARKDQKATGAKPSVSSPKVAVTDKPNKPTAQTPSITKTEEKSKPTQMKGNDSQLALTDKQAKPVDQKPAGAKAEDKSVQKPAPVAVSQAKEPVVAKQMQPSEQKSEGTAPGTKTGAALPLLTQKPAPAGVSSLEQKPLILANKSSLDQWGGYPQREKVKYSSQGRRDPFSPLFDRIEDYEFGVAPIPSVENLHLVGILQSYEQNLALLEDGRGFGYILQAGDKIKEGRVLRIDLDQVIFQVTEYGWTRNVTLELYNPTK